MDTDKNDEWGKVKFFAAIVTPFFIYVQLSTREP